MLVFLYPTCPRSLTLYVIRPFRREICYLMTPTLPQSTTRGAHIVKIPFGISGIDRGDCDGDSCDPNVYTDYGSPIWDTGIEEISNE